MTKDNLSARSGLDHAFQQLRAHHPSPVIKDNVINISSPCHQLVRLSCQVQAYKNCAWLYTKGSSLLIRRQPLLRCNPFLLTQQSLALLISPSSLHTIPLYYMRPFKLYKINHFRNYFLNSLGFAPYGRSPPCSSTLVIWARLQ